MELLQNVTLDEGSNLTRECNVTAGNPSPTVFWETGYTFEGNPLTITDITRSHRGEYICIANNTCGRGSAMMFIDVQCKNIYSKISFCCFYSPGIVMFTIRGRSFSLVTSNLAVPII